MNISNKNNIYLLNNGQNWSLNLIIQLGIYNFIVCFRFRQNILCSVCIVWFYFMHQISQHSKGTGIVLSAKCFIVTFGLRHYLTAINFRFLILYRLLRGGWA